MKNQKLKTIDIKGKPYVEVNERIKYFRENYKDFCLESDVLEKTATSVMIKATIRDADGNIRATGIAEEIKGTTFINKTSYVENCETSAWGRALANLGIGIDTSVASANEVTTAIEQQNKKPKKRKPISADRFEEAILAISEGKYTHEQLRSSFDLTKEQLKSITAC